MCRADWVGGYAMKRARPQWLKLSGWTIPLTYASAALAVGMILRRLEHHLLPRLVSTMSAPAAMAICSSITSVTKKPEGPCDADFANLIHTRTHKALTQQL